MKTIQIVHPDEIHNWAERNHLHFSSLMDDVLHLHQEVEELHEAVCGNGDIGEELADIIILALHLSKRLELNIGQEIDKKFQILLKRKYKNGRKCG